MRVIRVAHHAVVDAWRQRERELRALGHDLTLYSAVRWNEGGREQALAAGADEFVTGVRTFGSHPNAFLYDPRPLWRALGSDADVIDLHEEPVSLATAEVLLLRRLRGNRAPYVLYSAQNIDKRYPLPFRWFERWALAGASALYVCNREAGEIAHRKGLKAAAPLIPLGVDVAEFSPVEKAEPAAEPVVGYVGRLEAHKGVSHLIEAIASRPGWRLQLTGDGPQRDALTAQAERLGAADRVEFLGFASGAELAARYRALDVLAVPSLPTPGWLEQFCRVAVEAMASGVPVVASRSGAIPDVLGDAGVLVEPGDAAALAAGLDRALEPGTWRELRERGRRHAEDFAWSRVAAQHDELYRAVAGRGRESDAPAEVPAPQVVVIAYGSPVLLESALAGLGGEFPVTIVDNSSSAETRAVAERHGAFYIDPERNLGFGAGVNVAVRSLAERGLADADVLLLNPDALVSAASVRAMQRALVRDPRLAAVGASQTDPRTGEQVRVWWPFPSPARMWLEAFGLGRLNRAKDFAIGSVLLLRAEALAAVGEFDERFFLYAEEVDWQKRARDAGWRIAVEQTDATHLGAATESDSGRREALFHAAGEKYIRKHFGDRGWSSYRAAATLGAAVRAALLPGERGRAAAWRRDRYRRGPLAELEAGR
ncbi:hypothetical protein GCM10022286_18150 [Gryllotalpicola daejeonensis]|uniref:D-inositol 3-phosphate glycosyltransferase n=1 Tax=Gryllotalpicola daejeonensis TaxID=993087 RepID=A0ABP7ZK63_9MICO